tara:strand:+ start:761 stop:868 length:108 start_codon:yes stop_codon:yes gene_type:complete
MSLNFLPQLAADGLAISQELKDKVQSWKEDFGVIF